ESVDSTLIFPYTLKYEEDCSATADAAVGRREPRRGVQGPGASEPAPGLLRPREGRQSPVGRRDPGSGGDPGADLVPPPRHPAAGRTGREPEARAVHLLFGAARAGHRVGAPADRVLLRRKP